VTTKAGPCLPSSELETKRLNSGKVFVIKHLPIIKRDSKTFLACKDIFVFHGHVSRLNFFKHSKALASKINDKAKNFAHGTHNAPITHFACLRVFHAKRFRVFHPFPGGKLLQHSGYLKKFFPLIYRRLFVAHGSSFYCSDRIICIINPQENAPFMSKNIKVNRKLLQCHSAEPHLEFNDLSIPNVGLLVLG